MKTLILTFILTGLCVGSVYACDICGCGVGTSYIGILPDFHKKIIGIRYRYNSIFSHVGVGGATTYLTTAESYHTVELWGGWNITPNFRLVAAVPYSFNDRNNQGITDSKSGTGDINLTGYYQVLNSRKSVASTSLLVQSLWLGAGVKLPSGKYNPRDKSNENDNANLFQLGTGSVDYSANLMYDVRLQDMGLNIAGIYKLNTNNKYKYNYGNKLNLTAQAYYKFNIKNKLVVAPNAGLQYEHAKKDVDHKTLVDISGGRVLAGTLGLETSFSNIAIGANWQAPLSQNLANGIIRANDRFMVHVSLML